ncbi:MAG: exosortase [Proteobacteria bacterium]|nr:exosortase [Pseudomonadota bacterium]
MGLGYTIFYCFILLVIGLFPFNFRQSNNALLNQIDGLMLAPPSTVYTLAPPEKLVNINELSVLVELKTDFTQESGYARIISYSLDPENMNFRVAQWEDRLIFELKTADAPRGLHFEVLNIFNNNARKWILISCKGNKIAFYKDGELRKTIETGQIDFANWDKTYPLSVGSESNGKFCWGGSINRIAIYARSFMPEEVMDLYLHPLEVRPLIYYSFTGNQNRLIADQGIGKPSNLSVPEHFTPYKRSTLEKFYKPYGTTWRSYKYHLLDILVNIIGFIPLGFLLASYIVRKKLPLILSILLPTLGGFIVSFTIEILQTYLPGRSSSLNDLICNTIGVLSGSFAFCILHLTFKEDEKTVLARGVKHMAKKLEYHRYIGLIIFTLATLWMFYEPLRELLRFYWDSEYYSHIIIIPLISGFFLYKSRNELFGAPRYSFFVGSIVIAFSISIYILGQTVFVYLNQNDYAALVTFSGIVLWIGAFIFFYGTHSFRKAFFPFFFLLFMVPIPSVIMDKILYVLQTTSSWVTCILFKIAQIPFTKDGFIFVLPNNLYIRIAVECSGIRSSIALLIISVIVNHIYLRKKWNKTVLLAAVFPITVVKNGIRIFVLSLLGIYVDRKFVVSGFLHEAGGIFFYLPALLLFLFVLGYLVKREQKTEK